MTSGQGKPPAEGTLQPSQIIAGKYLVERSLGSGGAGLVVAAINVQLGRKVAIKLLHAGSRKDTESMARLIREARAAASIRSEHVVDVLDVGQVETGSPFVVMEHLEGEDLDARVERAGPLPIGEAVAAVQEACAAVAAAHAIGIVHRDIKPANLFSTHDANGIPIIKVLDFGIAKAFSVGGPDAVPGGHKLTMEGESLGSPLYMSPEQVNGDPIDTRTDIWSLGVTLYELITGKTPFKANRIGPLYAKIMNDPPDPMRMHRPDVPPELEAVIVRCLQKAPSHRYASALELLAALSPFASRRRASVDELLRTTAPQRLMAAPQAPLPEARSVPPASAFAVTKKGGKQTLAIVALGGGALLGLIAFSLFFLVVKRAPPSAASQAPSASEAPIAAAPPQPPSATPAASATEAASAEAPAASASAKPTVRKPSLSIKTTR